MEETLHDITPPWDIAIPPLLNSVIQAPFREVDAATKKMLEANIYEIQIGLHWLIKLEWKSTYKIPGKRAIASAIEPTGKWLQAILKLHNSGRSSLALPTLSKDGQ